MSTLFSIRAACALLAAAPIFCFAAITTAGSESDSPAPAPTSFTKALPVLANAVGSGVDKACSPTHLTVTGKASNGSRLYVSALVPQFAAELRKSAKGSAKLTREQSREMQRLIDYATQAQKTGAGLPQEALDQIAANTGMSVQATMVCLSREQIGSR